jgi:hypothetical protein
MPARRFGVIVLLAGIGSALVLAHQLVAHPTTTVLDDGTLDCFQFVWNIWWLRTALLDLHTNPFFTRWLYHPDGVSLLFHTFSASLGLASIPLQLALPGGVVTAHNVLVFMAPVMLVVLTALLAREVTGDPWASLAAGLLATWTGAVVWFLPVIYLTATYLVAGVVWAWWRLHRRRRTRDIALVLALLVALVFAAQEYAMMALAILALDTVARLLAPRAFGLPAAWGRGTVATWTIAGVGLGLLARVAAANPGQPPPPSHVLLGSAHLTAFVSPAWLFTPTLAFAIVLYLGTAPLLLVATTGWLGGRRALFWAAVTIVLLLMACGPFVGFSHPLFAFGPQAPLDLTHPPPGHVRGPYWLALQLLPFLRVFRGAYRWVAVAEISLAVASACGLAALRRRLANPRTRALVTTVVLTAIPVLGLVDVQGHTNAVIPAVVPDAYQLLRDDPVPSAVLELPAGLTQQVFANLASRYMFHQTVHRKYLLDGTVARLPPGVRPVVLRKITTFTELPWVKYVVIHRDLMDIAFPIARDQVAQVETILTREGTQVHHDDAIDIYELTTFRPETVAH